jgi:hypothetical protein
MAQLDTCDRAKLRDRDYAYVDKDGERKLPINDEEHVRNAISRFGQTEFDSAAAKARAARKVLAAAHRHGIEVDEDDDVRRATR